MSAPLTADTITDEQIRELRSRARREEDMLTVAICNIAIDPRKWELIGNNDRDVARARCAEILNARSIIERTSP